MTKTITLEESAKRAVTGKELIKATTKVKSKKGTLGTIGVLTDKLYYKIVKGGFIIF